MGLVICQPEVVLRAEQIVLNLLQMLDGLIDLVDGGHELAIGEFDVTAELVLEVRECPLEVGYVYLLAPDLVYLPSVVQRL